MHVGPVPVHSSDSSDLSYLSPCQKHRAITRYVLCALVKGFFFDLFWQRDPRTQWNFHCSLVKKNSELDPCILWQRRQGDHQIIPLCFRQGQFLWSLLTKRPKNSMEFSLSLCQKLTPVSSDKKTRRSRSVSSLTRAQRTYLLIALCFWQGTGTTCPCCLVALSHCRLDSTPT